MIPERLIDNFTKYRKEGKTHTIYTHLFCVIIRIILGLIIYYKIGSTLPFYNIFLYLLFIIIICFFSYKLYITKNATWKVYIRTILIYIINIIITKFDSNSKTNRNISGILIIFDSLMGAQSRHIQNNFKD